APCSGRGSRWSCSTTCRSIARRPERAADGPSRAGADLRLERRRDRLVAAVVPERLLAIEPERREHGPILNREQDRRVARRKIRVLVQGPRRQGDDVSLPPREPHAVDDRLTLALHPALHGPARLPMRLPPRAR